MSNQETEEIEDGSATRRIRPWIAGVLTIFGWGVGLFYARQTRAAVLLAVASLLFGIVFGAAVFAYLLLNSPIDSVAGLAPRDFFEIAAFVISFVIAAGVWIYVAKQPRNVEKGGPIRLFGYVALWLAPVSISVVIALLIRSFWFQPFHIPAGSMKPTLEVNDYFVVEKSAYGYTKHSFVPFDVLLPEGRFQEKAPERGDVVIFRNPKDGLNTYVKRIIGLPGEEIRYSQGRLYINGVVIERELLEKEPLDCRFPSTGDAYIELLPNGKSYIIQECSGDHGPLDNVGPYQVPEGHYFMLGDNRDQSQDSRVFSMVGYIPFGHIIGRAKLSAQKDASQ